LEVGLKDEIPEEKAGRGGGEKVIIALLFFFFFEVLGLKLRIFTLSHPTHSIFVEGFSR
jgi:hypothetical protein